MLRKVSSPEQIAYYDSLETSYSSIKKISLLHYIGSKETVFKSHIQPNLPKDIDYYVEPFFGSGAVGFHLLESAKSNIANRNVGSKFFFNDNCPHLMNYYNYIKDSNRLDAFYIALNVMYKTSKYSNIIAYLTEYKALTEMNTKLLNEKNFLSAVAFQFAFSSCLRPRIKNNRIVAKPRILKNKKGIHTLQIRTITLSQLEYLKDLLEGVTLTCNDFLLRHEVPYKDAFAYIDPPYWDGDKKAKDYYDGKFLLEQHEELARILSSEEELKARGIKHWMLHIEASDYFLEKYKKFRMYKYKAPYTLGNLFRKKNKDSKASDKPNYKEFVLIMNY